MSQVKENFFADEEIMNQSLLKMIVQDLSNQMKEQESATLLVSGGSSPKMLYQSLSEQSLAWKNISIAMVDERWVDLQHEKSNQTFIQQSLIKNQALQASFFGMIDSNTKLENQNIQQAAERLNLIYSKLPVKPITILGMGTDGHTASFFPQAQGLDEALSSKNIYAVAIKAKQSEVTGVQTQRLTVTLDYLLSSKKIYLLIKGKEKLDVYQKALNCTQFEQMPVASLLQQSECPVQVYWCP